MSPIIFYIILSIIGFFCVIALSINAYFVKGMLDSINQVKVQTAVLIEKSESKESRLTKVEKELTDVRKKHHDVITLLIEIGFAMGAEEKINKRIKELQDEH